VGYLTLRFQLTTYGVATNIDVFDEKYLFAGCRFVVYLVAAIPNVIIIFLVLMAIGYLPYKLLPRSFRDRISRWTSSWSAGPLRLLLLGVVFAVALIQFVLRNCFLFGNLLLQEKLPEDWSSSVLLASDGKLTLYFGGLVAGTLLTGAIVLYVSHHGTATTAASRFWMRILIFLFAVEFLLLPVNYGVLISTQQLPRVCELSANEPPQKDNSRGWCGTPKMRSPILFAMLKTSA
jgi:hypothetical protein